MLEYTGVDCIPDSVSGLRIQVEILLFIPGEDCHDGCIDPWFRRATGTGHDMTVWLEFRHYCRVASETRWKIELEMDRRSGKLPGWMDGRRKEAKISNHQGIRKVRSADGMPFYTSANIKFLGYTKAS
jgi:hypothetical protein